MIEYEFNDNKGRWEFLFLTPDKKKYSLGYLTPDLPEADKVKVMVSWFNSILRSYIEHEKASKE